MTPAAIFHLCCPAAHAPVRHNVTLAGEHTGTPGVTAIMGLDRNAEPWCVLADHPANPGLSLTNGFSKYADAVCAVLECELLNIFWLEIDSRGDVDRVHVVEETPFFHPLRVEGAEPRTPEALLRFLELRGCVLDVRQDAALQRCLRAFKT